MRLYCGFYPRDVVSAVYATASWLGGWVAGWLVGWVVGWRFSCDFRWKLPFIS